MTEYDEVSLDLSLSYGDLRDAIEGFHLLLTEGYMAHHEDFDNERYHQQVRAASYLMGMVRRRLMAELERGEEAEGS